jgi:hypothetical protein
MDNPETLVTPNKQDQNHDKLSSKSQHRTLIGSATRTHYKPGGGVVARGVREGEAVTATYKIETFVSFKYQYAN